MSLSKKTRFEIFSRDKFTCQYCGRKVPDTVLEVDHIIPKSKNGTDDFINLITSCFDCNRGKSNRQLTDRVSRADIGDEIEKLKAQEEQLKDYYKYLKKVVKSKQKISPELKIIKEYISENMNFTLLEEGELSIKRFLRTLTVEEIIDSFEITKEKKITDPRQFFKYACGCMHQFRIRKQEGQQNE